MALASLFIFAQGSLCSSNSLRIPVIIRNEGIVMGLGVSIYMSVLPLLCTFY
jgi:hypothetical protein